MTFDVFISYSHHDKATAEAACAKMEAAGVRCWIAPRDITPGLEWGAAIVQAIDHCRLMVLIFSSKANESSQVRREVERAISRSIPIVPMRIEDVPLTDALAYFMNSVHWLDALTPPIEAHLQRLVEAVKALLNTRLLHPEVDGPIGDGPASESAAASATPSGEGAASAAVATPGSETTGPTAGTAPAINVVPATPGERAQPQKMTARLATGGALIVLLSIVLVAAIWFFRPDGAPATTNWTQLPPGTRFESATGMPVPTFTEPDRKSKPGIEIPPGTTVPQSGTDQRLESATIGGQAWLRFPLGDNGQFGYVPADTVKQLPPS